MERAKKELLISRICSGSIRLKVGYRDKVYIIKKPTREQSYIANEIYFDALRDAELEGLYSEEELMDFLLENNFWNVDDDNLLNELPKHIEEFKLSLFQMVFKSDEKKKIRKALKIARDKYTELTNKKSAYNHLSCNGHASLIKMKYLIGSSLYSLSGNPIFSSDNEFWTDSSNLLEEIMNAYASVRIEESEYREIARTEPWKLVWSCSKQERCLFGLSPADYTEEQISLVNWTSLYDNINQHPDCPSEEVISDDDILDGWMIHQRRKHEEQTNKAAGDALLKNEKIRNAGEVFIVADTKEDAKKVFNMNDNVGKSIQKQRFNYLNKKGVVNEADMPDTRQKIMADYHKMFVNQATGK